MKKLIKIEVEIDNIEVDDGYFSFDYKVWIAGKKSDEGSYDSDYENGHTPSSWKKELERGEAMHLALQQAFG